MIDAASMIATSSGALSAPGSPSANCGMVMPSSGSADAASSTPTSSFSGLLAQSASKSAAQPANPTSGPAADAATADAGTTDAATLDAALDALTRRIGPQMPREEAPGVLPPDADQAGADALDADAADALGLLADVGTRMRRLLPQGPHDPALARLRALLAGDAAAAAADPNDPLAAGQGIPPGALIDDQFDPIDTIGDGSALETDDAETAGDDAATAVPALLTPLAAVLPAPVNRASAIDAGASKDGVGAIPERRDGREGRDGEASRAAAPRAARLEPRQPAATRAEAPSDAPAAPGAAGPTAQAAEVDAARWQAALPERANAAPKAAGADTSNAIAAPGWMAHRESLSAAATAAPAAPFHAQLSAAIDSPAFSSALSLQLTTMVSGEVSEARLHLHPAELGPIAVQIGLDGQMAQVHLAVEHSATRQALEQALPELARALQDAGFTMTGGGVSQQARDPQATPNAAPSSRGERGGADDAPLAAVAAPVARRSRGLLDVYA